jgi:hypothetical protein
VKLKKIAKYKIGSFNWHNLTTPKRSFLRKKERSNGRGWAYTPFFENPPTKSFFKKCIWLVIGRNIVSWKLG